MPRRRYSYSFTNAYRFFAFYNKLIDMQKNPAAEQRALKVAVSTYNCNPITFQNRLVDGLKWVVENFAKIPPHYQPEYSIDDYALLKINLKTTTESEHVLLELRIYKTTGRTEVKTLAGVEEVISFSDFRAQVEDFLNDPLSSIKMFKDLNPTEGDMAWLKGITANPDLVCRWNGPNLTIVKARE